MHSTGLDFIWFYNGYILINIRQKKKGGLKGGDKKILALFR